MTKKAETLGCLPALVGLLWFVVLLLKGVDCARDGYVLLVHEDNLLDAISPLCLGIGFLGLDAAAVTFLLAVLFSRMFLLVLSLGLLFLAALSMVLGGVAGMVL